MSAWLSYEGKDCYELAASRYFRVWATGKIQYAEYRCGMIHNLNPTLI